MPLGAGGFGFLPLHMMKKFQLVEKEAAKAGLKLTVNYANIGGPAVMNDALLSGSADFISAGPPAFLILWDRTKGKGDVKGVAAMSTMPMYLNTKADHLKSLETLKDDDKIAVTAVKVSIPSIIMQMYAQEAGQGPDVRVRPVHRVDAASRRRGRHSVRQQAGHRALRIGAVRPARTEGQASAPSRPPTT